MRMRIIIAALFIGLLALLGAGPASAETPTGTISVATVRPGNVVEFTGTTNESQVHSKIGNTWGAWVPSSNGQFDLKAAIPIGTSQMCVYVMNPGAQTNIGCVNVTGYSLINTAQFNAEISYIDPNRTVDWQLVTPPEPITWSGEAIVTENKILISNLAFFKDVRTLVRHEWSHELQWRYAGSTVAGMDALTNQLNAMSGTTDGIEHSADCMAVDMNANTTLAYGCPVSLEAISQQMIPANQPF